MKVCLIHSPGAGEGDASREALLELCARHGYDATYRASREADWETCFDTSPELVIVAGGDGTVKRVGLALAGKPIPMAVLPTGTANNIANALGSVGELDSLVASFRTARRVRIVVGVARGPWGEKRFVEGVGFGLFARTMRDADDARGEDERVGTRSSRLREDLELLLAHAHTQPASHAEIWLDGQNVAGEFLLVGVMSIPSVGPRLELAPSKDAEDDVFHVALVPARHREELKSHLADRKDERHSQLCTIVRTARTVKARWFGRDVHIDDDVWPKNRGELQEIDTPIEVDIAATDAPITALVPGARKGRSSPAR